MYDNNFNPLIDQQVLDSINQLLQKVDKQSSQQIERLKFKQDESNSLHVYEEINKVIMQTNNIYNLCMQQLRQELLNNKMESHSIQYQKIFNGLNQQLTQVVSAQVQIIKYHQSQDKKQIKYQKMIEQKSYNKPSIPIFKTVNNQEIKEDIALEQKIINELQKTENLRQEKDKLLLDTKLKIMKAENDIFKSQSETSDNINQINQCLTSRNRNKQQKYSGAQGVYGGIQKNLYEKSKSTNYSFLGLQSYEELDNEDDNLSPFSKQKKKEEKEKKKQNLANQLIRRLQNGEIDQIICEFRIEFEQALNEKRHIYDNLFESYTKVKDMLESILESLKNCKCGIFSKYELQNITNELEIIQQQIQQQTQQTQQPQQKQQQQNESPKKKYSLVNSMKITPTPQVQQKQSINGFVNMKSFNDDKLNKMAIEDMIYQASSPTKQKFDKNEQLIKTNSNDINRLEISIQSQNGENLFEDMKQQKSKLRNNNNLSNSSTNEEEMVKDENKSTIIKKGRSKSKNILNQGSIIQKFDNFGKPEIDERGKPIYIDKSGQQLTVALDAKGQAVIDELGQPVFQNLSGNRMVKVIGKDGQVVMKLAVQVEGYNLKLDSFGNPMVNSLGQPIFIDSKGNQLVVQLDEFGTPQLDETGKPLYEDQNGNTLKSEISNGQIIIKKNIIGVQGFIQKLDKKGYPVLNKNGQAIFINNNGNELLVQIDVSGQPILDEKGKPILLDNSGNIIKPQLDKSGNHIIDLFGKPIFVDSKGKQIILPKAIDSIPQFQSMVEEEEQKFIIQNGKKVQIFKNEEGEFFQNDKNQVVLDKTQNIVTEIEKVQVQQNFIIDQNGKKQQVKMNKKGKPYYVGENGKKIDIPKKQGIRKDAFTYKQQYTIDQDTGTKQEVIEEGQQYVINEKEVINQSIYEPYQVNKDGIIINENGKKQKVAVNQFGEQCIMDKQVALVTQKFAHKDNLQMQQQIFTNQKGDQFILDKNKEQILLKTDDKGNKFFETKDGLKQQIPQTQSQKDKIFMNNNADMHIKDADRKQKKVIADDLGQQFIVNNDETQVALNSKQQSLNFQVQTNQNADIVNKIAENLTVKKDKNENEYVLENKVKKLIINNKLNDVKIIQKQKQILKNDVYKDEKGNNFIFDKKSGQKNQVQISKDGKPYTVAENGQVMMVNSQDQPQVLTDDKGNEFVSIGGKKQEIKTNKIGEKIFINENGKEQIIQEIQHEEYVSDDQEDKNHEFVDEDGNCKYCGKPFIQQKYKGEVFVDEHGERYILDENGNKAQVQFEKNGQLFYHDVNGNKIIISKTARISVRPINNLIKKNQRQITVNQDQKSYDKVYRKFATDDTEVIEKISQMDEESQEKLIHQFNSKEFNIIINNSKSALNNDLYPLLQIYETMRNIGANFKMSLEEFEAKFKIYKKVHQKCGNNCEHLDIWFKQMFLKNQIARLGGRYNKMLKNKIDPKVTKMLALKVIKIKSESKINSKQEADISKQNQSKADITKEQIQDQFFQQNNNDQQNNTIQNQQNKGSQFQIQKMIIDQI